MLKVDTMSNNEYKRFKIQNELIKTQDEIKQIRKDLKYITMPEIRAVADNMLAHKQQKVIRLKEELKQINKSIDG